jgi:hypothetical protein
VTRKFLITYGAGGAINEHNLKFAGYRNIGAMVEIRGGCYSACTLISAYVGKDKTMHRARRVLRVPSCELGQNT